MSCGAARRANAPWLPSNPLVREMTVGRSSPRRTSRRVATSPGCVPLREAYDAAVDRSPRTWGEVEDLFLAAMEAFDENVASSLANQGDIQNGKGDFFNDLLALVLETCGGVSLTSRSQVPGLVFPRHNLDVTYPSTGVVQFLLEAKAVGIPKHPRNERQRNPLGRPGSADLPKRIKEAGFKTIDLKAEYGRIMAARGVNPGGGPGGNLTTWLRANKPTSYLFIAARVVDEGDQRATQSLARAASQVMDGVGLYMFAPRSSSHPTTYRTVTVDRDIELPAVLFRACQDLGSIQPEVLDVPPGPAAQALEALDESSDAS
jgi:hypothetical protein